MACPNKNLGLLVLANATQPFCHSEGQGPRTLDLRLPSGHSEGAQPPRNLDLR